MTGAALDQAEGATPWTFQSFEPGTVIGTTPLLFDRDMIDQWGDVFGAPVSDTVVPMAAIPLLLMRAFADVVVPRPPGNLHVGQQCELHRLPRVEEKMVAKVTCRTKELHRERKVVQFQIDICDAADAQPLCSGLTTIFWAL
jgi:hypothetical protein